LIKAHRFFGTFCAAAKGRPFEFIHLIFIAPFVWIGANAILLYFINGLIGFEPVATRFVGGDVANFFDDMVTDGAGLFVANLVGLGLVVLLARFLYKREIFLRV
jgi:hypothetical protein